MRQGGLRWIPAAFVCGICVVMYPIFLHPYFFPEKWQDVQRITRSGIEQEKIQPAVCEMDSNTVKEVAELNIKCQ